jgi:hypothetical protein
MIDSRVKDMFPEVIDLTVGLRYNYYTIEY